MTDLDKIKAKLKKLLALSKSPNANEAALALEMAQKLMAKHSIYRNAVNEFDVISGNIKGNSGKSPPHYEISLVSSIAEAFGCKNAYGLVRHKGTLSWGHTFVGLEHRVQIAVYMTDVLLRKLKKARGEYIKKLNRVRLRSNKIIRADRFCFGWVSIVISKLAIFTNTGEEQTAIDNHVAGLRWGGKVKPIIRKASKIAANDFSNGWEAGAAVRLQHGVEGRESGARLLGAQ